MDPAAGSPRVNQRMSHSFQPSRTTRSANPAPSSSLPFTDLAAAVASSSDRPTSHKSDAELAAHKPGDEPSERSSASDWTPGVAQLILQRTSRDTREPTAFTDEEAEYGPSLSSEAIKASSMHLDVDAAVSPSSSPSPSSDEDPPSPPFPPSQDPSPSAGGIQHFFHPVNDRECDMVSPRSPGEGEPHPSMAAPQPQGGMRLFVPSSLMQHTRRPFTATSEDLDLDLSPDPALAMIPLRYQKWTRDSSEDGELPNDCHYPVGQSVGVDDDPTAFIVYDNIESKPQAATSGGSFTVYHNPEASIGVISPESDAGLVPAGKSEGTILLPEPIQHRGGSTAGGSSWSGSGSGSRGGGHFYPYRSNHSIFGQTSHPTDVLSAQRDDFAAKQVNGGLPPPALVLPMMRQKKDAHVSPANRGLVPVSPLKEGLLARQTAALRKHYDRSTNNSSAGGGSAKTSSAGGGSAKTSSGGGSSSSKVSTLGWFGEKKSRGNGGGVLWGMPTGTTTEEDYVTETAAAPPLTSHFAPVLVSNLPPVAPTLIASSLSSGHTIEAAGPPAPLSQKEGLSGFFRLARPTTQSPRGSDGSDDLGDGLLSTLSPKERSPPQPKASELEGYFHSPDQESALRVVASLIAELRDNHRDDEGSEVFAPSLAAEAISASSRSTADQVEASPPAAAVPTSTTCFSIASIVAAKDSQEARPDALLILDDGSGNSDQASHSIAEAAVAGTVTAASFYKSPR